MKDSEKLWRGSERANGWKLPAPAHWFFRLPVIRRIRCIYKARQIEGHYSLWDAMGPIRTGYDEWVLYAIARGWC